MQQNNFVCTVANNRIEIDEADFSNIQNKRKVEKTL
jgi:hypothetical protein